MKIRFNWVWWGCLLVLLCPLAVAQKTVPKNPQKTSKVSTSQYIDLANFARKPSLDFNLDRISSRSYSLKPSQTVRVLLAGDVSSAKVQYSGPVHVYALEGNLRRYKFDGPGALSAKVKDDKVQVGWISSTEAIVIDPQRSVNLTFQGRVYNGVFVLLPRKGKMMVVEHTDLEDYLLGVIGYEMTPTSPLEALKAQAVTARTYARFKMQKKFPDYDLRSTPADQTYRGIGNVSDTVRLAVNKTRGRVLMYNNELLITFYHASCGGHTRNGKVLTGREVPPPLRGVSCSNCVKTSGHGVGMCQTGAQGLAKKNYSYQAILNHYFPGAKPTIL